MPHARYADAVLREIDWHLEAAGGSLGPLTSIFFGGGTPSLWAADELGRVLRAIRAAFAAPEREHGEIEVTVECNPSSLDDAQAEGLAAQGVNRLSVGVQALDGGRLRYLGRLHDAEGALKALRAAQRAVPRVSGDLMFGTPGQPAGAFLEEVKQLVELGLSHLSIYALTIEPNTQFGELHRKGRLPLARDDDYADTFLAIESLLSEQGFQHYEVSNYARPDQTSQHNQHYWRGGDYLGLGCAAVGCRRQGVGRARRARNQTSPEKYQRAESLAALCAESEELDGQGIVREALLLGLRTAEGVDLHDVRARSGIELRTGRQRALQRALERGNIELDQDRLRVPHSRWLHLDSIVADLF